MASQIIQPSSAEQRVILACLRRVRRRLYAVRLAERVVMALAWGAMIALCLVAERLLRQPYPVLSVAVGLLPLGWAAWLFTGAETLAREKRAYRLSRTAGFLLACTAVLGAAGVVLYLKESGQLQVPMRRLFLAAGLAPAAAAVWLWFGGRQLLRDSSLSRQLLQAAAGLTAVLALAETGLLMFSGADGPLWMLPVAVMLIFAAFAAATVRPIAAQSAAMFVDQQAGLQERVATALELFASPAGSGLEAAFRAPVIASAVHACQSVRSAKIGYARIDSRVYALAAAVAVTAAGISLLSPLAARANAVRLPNQVLVRQGDALTKKLQEIEATKKIEDPAIKAELAKLSRVAESMQKGDMSAFDANTKLSEIAQSLQDQKQQNSMADVEKAMEASKETNPLAQASEEVKSAALSAGSNAPGAEHSRESAATKVQDAAKDLANKLGGMTEQEKKDLANQLNQAADKAKDPQLKKDLQDAAKAAEQGDSKGLQHNMADAGNRMGEQGAQQQLSQEAVKQAMDQINQAQGGDSGQQNPSQNNGGQQNGGSPQPNSGGQNQSGQGNREQNQAGGQGGQQNQGGQGDQQGSQGQSQGGAAANGQSPGGNPLDDPRNGSTNFNQPGAPGDHSAGHPLGGTETFVRIYDENPLDSRGKIENTPGHINPLGISSGSIDTHAAGDKSSPTIRSYESELPAARKRALDDLATQQIPPEDKDLIRSFYSDDSH